MYQVADDKLTTFCHHLFPTKMNTHNSMNVCQPKTIQNVTYSLPGARTKRRWMCKDIWHWGDWGRSERCTPFEGFLASGDCVLWYNRCFQQDFCLSGNIRRISSLLEAKLTCSWEVLGKVKRLVEHRTKRFSTSKPRLWSKLSRLLAA